MQRDQGVRSSLQPKTPGGLPEAGPGQHLHQAVDHDVANKMDLGRVDPLMSQVGLPPPAKG